MMTEYKCDGAKMKTVEEKLDSIKEDLEEALTLAKAVQDKIDSKEHWNSNSQLTMSAFMDLLIQYHNDFINGDNAPVPKGVEQLEDLQSNLADFYDGWTDYENLGKIV